MEILASADETLPSAEIQVMSLPLVAGYFGADNREDDGSGGPFSLIQLKTLVQILTNHGLVHSYLNSNNVH